MLSNNIGIIFFVQLLQLILLRGNEILTPLAKTETNSCNRTITIYYTIINYDSIAMTWVENIIINFVIYHFPNTVIHTE